MRASIQREGSDRPVPLDRNEVVAARFGDKLALRMTPSIVGKLYAECRELLVIQEERLDALSTEGAGAAKKLRDTTQQVNALRGQIINDRLWISLVTDHLVPTPGSIQRLKGCVWLARGKGWSFPSTPAVVLALAEHDDPEADEAVLDPMPQLPTQTANIEADGETAPVPATQTEPADPSSAGPQPKTKGNPRRPPG
jgi:hypothetical protein